MSKQDTEIISLLLSKEDEPARSTLIQDIRIKFEKIARYKGVQRDDVDDVVSDGIEKLLKNLNKFHGRGSFNGWATVSFGNHCIDYFRHLAIGRRLFQSVPPVTDKNEDNPVGFDLFTGDSPDACENAANQQQLDRVLSAMDSVISETSVLRKHGQRDAEIAELGLRHLLEPKEILHELADRFPGLTLNAIRIVLHVFRSALREELNDEP